MGEKDIDTSDLDALKILCFDLYDNREKLRAKLAEMAREEEKLSMEIFKNSERIKELLQ